MTYKLKSIWNEIITAVVIYIVAMKLPEWFYCAT